VLRRRGLLQKFQGTGIPGLLLPEKSCISRAHSKKYLYPFAYRLF
jgi:hypothetical protein